MKPSLFAASALVALPLITLPALAQTTPEGLRQVQPVSQGREDVAVQGFEAPAVVDPAHEDDATELKLSAGGLLTSGNTSTLAVTSAGRFRSRRGMNQLSAAASANYGEAAPPGTDDRETNVENYQGRIRYDRFLTPGVALFIALSALHDRFQGLEMRLNLDPGLALYMVDEPKHRLWLELGYDLQQDYRSREAIDLALAEENVVLERTEVRHSGRFFAGYSNNLSEAVTFDTGLEYLQAFTETENYRLNWDVGLTSSIGGNFSLGAAFNLRYDHNPLPGIRTTDTTTSLSLIYQLL